MSQVPEDTQPPPPSVRLGRTLTGVPRWVRREAVESWAAMRAAERRTVVGEVLVCALATAFCLLPLLLAPPERPTAVLEGVWAALIVPARRVRPVAAVLCASLLLVGDNVWTLAVVPLSCCPPPVVSHRSGVRGRPSGWPAPPSVP